MPIYEYRCTACRKKVTVLTLRASEVVEPVCEHCGSRALTRLMSRFALVRSEESRLDGLGDPSSLGDLDENDPKSVARSVRAAGTTGSASSRGARCVRVRPVGTARAYSSRGAARRR